ncbi:MAG: MCE family protein [Candidatus Omnitrophica bacterium]|nr:MCE family protein [Candidatus Omnitrophota bacterium]
MKTKEIALGAFIVGALVIFIIAIFSINDFRIFNPGYTIKVFFNFGDGMKPASPVRVSGVDVGEVKNIALVNVGGKTKVCVYAWIRRTVKIPQGSEAFVNNLSILGQKYLEIIPKEDPTGYLKDGDSIIGQDSVPIYRMGEFARNILVRFDRVLTSFAKLVEDQEITETFKKFVGSLQGASTNLETLLNDLKSGKGTIGKLFYEDALYTELEEFVTDLKTHPWKLLHKPRK